MKASPIQTNFTGGELSDELYGRVDIQKYQNSAKELYNCYPLVFGGVKDKGGSWLISRAKFDDRLHILIPFKYNNEQSYILEIGHHYIRFYTHDGQIQGGDSELIINGSFTTDLGGWQPVGTPGWSAGSADLSSSGGVTVGLLQFIQTVPGSTYIVKINASSVSNLKVRASDFGEVLGGTSFSQPLTNGYQEYSFVAQDNVLALFLEKNSNPSASTGYIADISIKKSTTEYEVYSPYTEAMLRELEYEQTLDTMLFFHETLPTYRLQRFSSSSWKMGKLQFAIEPFAEVGVRGIDPLTLSALSNTATATITLDSSNDYLFLMTDVGRELAAGTGRATISGYASSSVVNLSITAPFDKLNYAPGEWLMTGSPVTGGYLRPTAKDPVGAIITLNSEATSVSATTGGPDLFRSQDVGKYVRINGGVVQITGYTNARQVGARIMKVMTSAINAIGGSWSLESSMWGGASMYPRTGSFKGQRLIVGGSPGDPVSIEGSKIGESFNFFPGTADDDGFIFKISESTDQIKHLTRLGDLLALSSGGIFVIKGGVEKAITPTNVQIDSAGSDGCNQVRPVVVGSQLYYVHSSGAMLLSADYDLGSNNSSGYTTDEASKIANHLASIGILQMTFQRRPTPRLVMILADGRIASATIDKKENVAGWSNWETMGDYESAASIPGPIGAKSSDLFISTMRLVNGVERRFIERSDESIKLDCAVRGESVTKETVWGGLDHFEGLIVTAVGDGYVLGDYEVIDGDITTLVGVNEIVIGLRYTARITMLPPEIATPTGTAQGKMLRVAGYTVRMKDSDGVMIRGERASMLRMGDVLDTPPALFSGDFSRDILGSGKNGPFDKANKDLPDFEIIQDQPLPMYVLAVVRNVTGNE